MRATNTVYTVPKPLKSRRDHSGAETGGVPLTQSNLRKTPTSNLASRHGYAAMNRSNDHGAPPIPKLEPTEVGIPADEIEYAIPRDSSDPNAPTMPPLTVRHSGNKESKMITENLNSDPVARRLDREPEAILEFLGYRLGAHHNLRYAPNSIAGCR